MGLVSGQREEGEKAGIRGRRGEGSRGKEQEEEGERREGEREEEDGEMEDTSKLLTFALISLYTEIRAQTNSQG